MYFVLLSILEYISENSVIIKYKKHVCNKKISYIRIFSLMTLVIKFEFMEKLPPKNPYSWFGLFYFRDRDLTFFGGRDRDLAKFWFVKRDWDPSFRGPYNYKKEVIPSKS